MSHPDDAIAEAMANDIWDALAPMRHFHDDYDEGMDFDKHHEKAELALMKVLDKWYSAGYKDGVAEEKASWDDSPEIDYTDEHPV